jgi:Reverse transcriptase (RNA-dependent DNA polymerase)
MLLERKLNQFLVSLGLVRSSSDPGVYTLRTGNEFVILGLFVDDGLLAGSSMEVITKTEEALGAEFECRFSDGTNSIFIGLKIRRNRELKLLYLDQSRYTRKVLERFEFGQAKAVTTPMAHNVNLEKRGSDEVIDTSYPYREAVGSLLFISRGTRPDITYAVHTVAKFSAEPTQSHVQAVKEFSAI